MVRTNGVRSIISPFQADIIPEVETNRGGAVMNVIYSDKAERWTEGRELLHGATRSLEKVVGKHSPEIDAEWDRTDGENGPLLTLKIADWTGPATATFTKADLESPYDLRMGLFRLWDKLLERRLNKAVEKLYQDEK
jgi:hypothetical protein